MAGLIRVRGWILNGFFSNQWDRQNGYPVGFEDSADLGYGFEVIRNMFQYMRSEDDIIGCIAERERLEIHVVVDAFHVQIGSFVLNKLTSEQVSEKFLRSKVKHLDAIRIHPFQYGIHDQVLKPVPLQGTAIRTLGVPSEAGRRVEIRKRPLVCTDRAREGVLTPIRHAEL